MQRKLAEKREARKRWQLKRAPQDKQRYNKIAKELKHPLQNPRNEGIQTYLQELTPTEATDYSLWKATRKIKQPQHQIPPIRTKQNTWARTDKQKATAFAKHLASVFQPFPSQLSAMEEETVTNELNVPHQMALPMKKIRINEVKIVIQRKIHPTKAAGYDLITGKFLQVKIKVILRNSLCNTKDVYNGRVFVPIIMITYVSY